MAEVWRADATFEDGGRHEVAIKRVLPSMGQPMFRTMFEDEARLGMMLQHPNIVRVYDARDIGGTYIMVMELVDGDSLKGLLERAHERGAQMPLPAALHIARELARALEYAHHAVDAQGKKLGIIHRDVSPHNLLLGRDGSVKLTDFGLADASVNATLRSEDMVGGKLGYLAPEIIRQQPHGAPIDLFALGIVLWEMLAGRRLFQGKDDSETVQKVARCEVPSICEINGRVPSRVEALLLRLLAPDPVLRPSGAQVVQAVDELLAGAAVGPGDVALLVGLHQAQKAREKPEEVVPLGMAELLEHELEQFAAGGDAPLDPRDFGGISSGVRARPRPEDD